MSRVWNLSTAVGPEPESQRRLPAPNLTVKHGENQQKTVHIRSDQSYLQAPCDSAGIHTLFSQLRLKNKLKRRRLDHRVFHVFDAFGHFHTNAHAHRWKLERGW